MSIGTFIVLERADGVRYYEAVASGESYLGRLIEWDVLGKEGVRWWLAGHQDRAEDN